MDRPGGRRLIAAAAALAAAAVVGFAPLVPSVAVRDARTGRLAAALPAGKGDRVRLAYVHSANKGAVLDEFRVGGDGGLVLERSVFASFGAGMSDGLEPGVSMRTTPEGVELTGLNRRVGTLRLAVGRVAGHRLLSGGAEIELVRRASPGSSVAIAYERIPPAAAVRERVRNGTDARRREERN